MCLKRLFSISLILLFSFPSPLANAQDIPDIQQKGTGGKVVFEKTIVVLERGAAQSGDFSSHLSRAVRDEMVVLERGAAQSGDRKGLEGPNGLSDAKPLEIRDADALPVLSPEWDSRAGRRSERSGLPNLRPFQPPDVWDDVVVVSDRTDTQTDDTVYAGATAYIDYAYVNDGDADAEGTFFLELYVGEELIRKGSRNGLKQFYYGFASDVEHTFSQAGTYTLKLVCDPDDHVTESDETDNAYERTVTIDEPGQPNLTPYQPDEWGDKIVVSRTSGTHTEETLHAGDTAYIAYAYDNNGDADITASFSVELRVNDIQADQRSVDGLSQGAHGTATDIPYTFSESGTYTLKLVCDPENTVAESDEDDNEYQRSKSASILSLPNLTPYQPNGWEDKIVVSGISDTTTDSVVYAGETAYIDCAYINNGASDISDTFSVGLYINGELLAKANNNDGLQQGYVGNIQDYEHTFSVSGTYTIKLVCDTDDTVTESDEGDNAYERTITVATIGDEPNLTPYQPEGWAGKIVVSANTGTHDDDPLVYAGETAYIDYAYINAGGVDIHETFSMELYVNDTRVSQEAIDGLAYGEYKYQSDIEHLFSQAGTYTLKLVCDATDAVPESDETDNEYEMTQGISGKPGLNLSPHQPNEWEEKIVVSAQAGTHTDDEVVAGQRVYMDYAYMNTGGGDIGKFYVELYVNDTRVRRAYTEGLEQGYFGHATDFTYTFLQAGDYTLKLVCDADDDISESDETDNTYERIIAVSGSTSLSPNLAPYKPNNWDNQIVVSNKKNTHTDDTLYAGETGYIDYAYINNGTMDIGEPFYVDVYINDTHAARLYNEGLDLGGYAHASDLKQTFSEAGTYTLKLICDTEGDITESDETDNEYQRTITVATGGEPDIRITPATLTFGETGTEGRRTLTNVREVQTLQDRTIHFLRGEIRPQDSHDAIHERNRVFSRHEKTRFPRHLLAQFGHLPSPEERRMLAEQGIRLLRYIPNNTYWVAMDPETDDSDIRNLKTAGGIQWIGIPDPEYKVAEAVDENRFPPNARYEDGTVRVHLLLFEDVSQKEATDAIGAMADEVQVVAQVSAQVLAVRTPLTLIREMAGLDQVEWIEPAPPPKIAFNETASERIKADTLRNTPLRLDGKGITVGVWDGGKAHLHDDFGDRLTVKDPDAEVSDHATHVAGTIGGSGEGDIKAKGMAPKISIESYDWNDDENEMREAVSNKIVISNHSYGFTTGWYWNAEERDWTSDTGFGQYSTVAQKWDQVVSDTGLIIFKAAGNDRSDGPDCPDGECDGPYDCIPQQGVSKNVITIGATDDDDEMTSFSSWGPANDGRIKPDICANGYSVRSTMPEGMYALMNGTSMATPAATGAGALLYQHFQNIVGQPPSPETLKALMIHGATDLGKIGPDFEYGWGLLNADETADLITRRAWQTGTLSDTGSTESYTMTVSEDASDLNVTLVWTDPAGAPEAAKALVNDLDLMLTDPNGVQHKPWILDKDHPETSAVRGVNHLDNVEQVSVTTPMAGEWTVNISGYAVPSGPQDFTVVADGITATSKSFRIHNDGTDTLTITGIDKGGDSWLHYLPAPPFGIAPGEHQSVTVTVDAGMTDADTGELLVYSNVADKSPYSIAIRLKGGAASPITAADDTAQTPVDTAVTIPVLENDSGTGLTVTHVSDPDNGSAEVTADNQKVRYTPDGGFSGEDQFIYTVSDSTQEAQATVSVSVGTDAAPLTAENDTAQTLTDTSVVIYVLNNDSGPEGKTLTVKEVSDPDQGTAGVNSDHQTIRYTPGSGFTGVDTFLYTVSTETETAQAMVSVTVERPVVPVSASDDTATTDMETAVTIRVLENDSSADVNMLTVKTVSDPSHGDAQVNADNRTVLYTPAAGFTGEETFTYTMSDGTETAQANVTVTVEASEEVCEVFISKDTPLDIPDSDTAGVTSTLMLTSGGEIKDVNVTVNVTHPWADDVSLYLISPANVQIPLFENVGGDGENFIDTTLDDEAAQSVKKGVSPFTGHYRPASLLSILDGGSVAGEWRLKATDAEEFDEGILNSWNLTLCHLPSSENRAPTLKADTAATGRNTAVSIDVLANDSDLDGDKLRVTQVSDPARGSAAIDAENDRIIYTPETDFAGTDTITYTVSDTNGGTESTGVRVTVYSRENLLKDGGFETGTTSTDWTDVSAQFGKNVYQETRMARSGEWLAWFEGGDVGQETATVNQKITIPESEGATLRFWLRKYLDDVSGTLKVSMDEQLLLTVTEESDAYQEWTEVALDVSGFADGNRHTLNFDAAIQVGIGATSFLVDDVSLIAHEGGEGPVDLGDVISALQVAAGMHPAGITADVDINGDQKIGIEEAIHLLRMLGGK